MTISKQYEFIHDPGHGWLKVPLEDLNITPTQYSFKDAHYAYLEEDCDATEFWKKNPDITIKDVFVDHFNRNRARFGD